MPEPSIPMPSQAPEVPVLPIISGNPGISTAPRQIRPSAAEEMALTAEKYIRPSLIKYPVYEYQTGTTFFLSKKERIVVDAYEKSGNIPEACRALNKLLEAHGSTVRHSVKVIKRWLQRKPHVSRYIADRLVAAGKVNWDSKEKWLAENVDVRQGKAKWDAVQLGAWKEYGKSRGWYEEQATGTMTNVQINFTQKDGKS